MPEESNNLNLLRTAAVLSVFVAHVLPQSAASLNLGHAGVLLFFVHTSNVLMLSLRRHGDSWAQFMIRRYFRIYPLAIVAVFLYEALAVWHIGSQPPVSAIALLADLTLTQNIFHASSMPGVLWSLPFEIQMYLLLPAVFWAVSRRKQSAIDLVAAWIAIAFVLAAVILMAPIWIVNLVRFVPCFLAGVMAFALPKGRRLPPVFLSVLVVIGLAAYSLASDFLLSAWLLCFVVGFGLPMIRELSARPITATCAFIAKYSYGIYLFHSLFLWILLHRLGLPVGVPVAFLGTLLTSWLAYHLLELRLTDLGIRISTGLFEPVHPRPEPLPAFAKGD
jgi:peptidoglycan/LPS O-acetylase OafA/YrhL